MIVWDGTAPGVEEYVMGPGRLRKEETRMITKNHGLKGGTLDSTKHLEAAIPRMLTEIEQKERNARLHGNLGVAIRTTPTPIANAAKAPLN